MRPCREVSLKRHCLVAGLGARPGLCTSFSEWKEATERFGWPLWVALCLPERYVEVLTPSTSECDRIWK